VVDETEAEENKTAFIPDLPRFSSLCLAAPDHPPADRLQGYTRLHLDRGDVRDASRHSGSAMCLQLHGYFHVRVGLAHEKSGMSSRSCKTKDTV
jgi:hypothetical protein